MQADHPIPGGLWLPLVTPFHNDVLDEASLRRLVRHYAGEPLDGMILAATTGEGLTLDDEETERLVALATEELAAAGKRLPLFLGLSGSDTRKVAKALGRVASWPLDGYLVACPYYTRPSQEGMVRHFSALAGSTVSEATAPHSPGSVDRAALRRWTVCGFPSSVLMAVGALVRMVVGAPRAAGCRPSLTATGTGCGQCGGVPGVLI